MSTRYIGWNPAIHGKLPHRTPFPQEGFNHLQSNGMGDNPETFRRFFESCFAERALVFHIYIS